MGGNHSLDRPCLSKLAVNGSKSERGAPYSVPKKIKLFLVRSVEGINSEKHCLTRNFKIF